MDSKHKCYIWLSMYGTPFLIWPHLFWSVQFVFIEKKNHKDCVGLSIVIFHLQNFVWQSEGGAIEKSVGAKFECVSNVLRT